jgi:hypothetical protein
VSRARLAFVAAGLLAAVASLAFVRTTDPSTNVCLYWAARTVHYSVNYGRTIQTPTPIASPTCSQAAEQTAIETAFSQWTGAVQSCTDLNLVFDGQSTKPVGYAQGSANENTIAFRSGWCSVVKDPATNAVCPYDPNATLAGSCANKLNCFEDRAESGQNTLALTTTTYNQNTGELLDADTELNGWDGTVVALVNTSAPSHGWYLTCATTTPQCASYGDDKCIWVDVQNTMTHEAGHFIGLAHETHVTATMNPYSGPGDTAKRTLAQDDIDGLCTIYPANKATATCVVNAPHHSSGGCATGGAGAGASALLLAAAALLPRLRRRRA